MKMISNIFITILFTASLLVATPQTRIVNGSEVSQSSDRWSWIVSLQNDGEHKCGGTLISNEWIITAAHCLLDDRDMEIPMSNLHISTGSYYLYGDYMREYSIEKTVIHPNYNTGDNDSDIALIKIINYKSNDTFPKLTKDISLYTGRQSWVAGWGALYAWSSNISTQLNELSVPLVDYNICNSFVGYDGVLTKNMICAGYMLGGRDSCGGDSGGPLITYEGNEQMLIGVVSFGIGCAEMGHPGVYTNIRNYHDWIEYHINDSSEPTPPDISTVPLKGDITQLYVATFNRAPDAFGLSYWIDSDFSLEQIAMSFFDQIETQALYPDSGDEDIFINAVYQNLFNRAVDRAGLTYWSIALSSGSTSRSLFILAVINGALGDDNTILVNKQRVGEAFADRGLSDVSDARMIMSGVGISQESVDQALLMIDELSLDLLR